MKKSNWIFIINKNNKIDNRRRNLNKRPERIGNKYRKN